MSAGDCRGLQSGIPTKLPNYFTRAKLIAWAAVRFFHMTVTAVIECLLVASAKGPSEPDGPGRARKTSARTWWHPRSRHRLLWRSPWSARSRRSLHGHIIIWVEHGPTPTEFGLLIKHKPERTEHVLQWPFHASPSPVILRVGGVRTLHHAVPSRSNTLPEERDPIARNVHQSFLSDYISFLLVLPVGLSARPGLHRLLPTAKATAQPARRQHELRGYPRHNYCSLVLVSLSSLVRVT
jgi:hypothetical protein